MTSEEFPELLICYLIVNHLDGDGWGGVEHTAISHNHLLHESLFLEHQNSSYLDPGFSLFRNDDKRVDPFTCNSTSRNLADMYSQRCQTILTLKS